MYLIFLSILDIGMQEVVELLPNITTAHIDYENIYSDILNMFLKGGLR